MAMITMEAWMFLPSFKELRPGLLSSSAMWSMWHLGARAFDTISGEIVRTTAFVLQKCSIRHVNGRYRRLVKGKSEAEKLELLRNPDTLYNFNSDDFERVPESRWAYWLTDSVLRCFDSGTNLESAAPVRQGFQTGNNSYFMRYWHEVDLSKLKLDATCKEEVFKSECKWVPYNKGGEFRKWYDNNEYVVAFDKKHYDMLLVSGNCLPSRHLYFRESVTWSAMGGTFGARLSPQGFTFSAKGACAFPNSRSSQFVLTILNSRVTEAMFEFLAPTLDFNVGSIRQLPLVEMSADSCASLEEYGVQLIGIAKNDWDQHEESWDFLRSPLLSPAILTSHINSAYAVLEQTQKGTIESAAERESNINRILLNAYGLQSELSHEVSYEEITLCRPDQTEDIKRLLSYVIGCMMGRYSLDKPGLIYAHSGNLGFDASHYKTFRSDDDGIIPLLETDWGIRDDATNRFEEFVSVAWPKEHLDENLKFVAESLDPISDEQPRETIRRFFASVFYKHHLSIYKKRPIYWLFSSGKLRAYQCIVYLHRYNEGTLARMRTEYVIPLQGQIAARIDQLEGDKAKATSTSHRNKIQKEQDKLKKQQVELAAFEEKLKHYADMRISLDLDDGVKVNYAKFGDLVAESKAITGGKDDE
jgi:hypothetical protein